jgi:hypothetical protein
MWLLANRVAASRHLRRSHRLKELLLFLMERALRQSGVPIHEQEIGAAVFGRPLSYDTSSDTIVRVHTFQLRKRLRDYFEDEGAAEPILIDIPRGSYSPEFLPREASLPSVGRTPVIPRHWRFFTKVVVAGLAILVGGILLGWQLRSFRDSSPKGVADTFWRQMFSNGRRTDLVVADASLTLFEDMLGRTISVQEYQRRQWAEMESVISDPARRDLASTAILHSYAAFTAAVTALNLGVTAARNGTPIDIVFARDFSARHLENTNVILEGNPRANPWMQFFEADLNFQYAYDDAPPSGYFRNTRPRAGEEREYRVLWDRRGYCRIAHLPNLGHAGTVLILAGTDLSSTEAGARFVTSTDWIEKLRQRLSLGPGAPLPFFEALLRTDLAVAAAPGFELIDVRARNQ